MKCPYCSTEMEVSETNYDQLGYSWVGWACPKCKAAVVVTNYPPPEEDNARKD